MLLILRMIRLLSLGIVLTAATASGVLAQTQSVAKPSSSSPTATSAALPTVPIAPLPEVRQALQQPGAVLLDVRTPEEYAAGHLPGALNLNYRAPDVAEQLARLNPANTYVLYCASGNRSSKTALLLQEQGFQHVVNAGAYSVLKEQQVAVPAPR